MIDDISEIVRLLFVLGMTNVRSARLIVRTIQFVCSTLAMSFAATGFYSGGATRSSTFVLLMGYTGMLYTVYYLTIVEMLHLAGRPVLILERGTDALLALLLLIAGICLALSDYTSHCSFGWHCNNLRAAYIFDFIAMASFLVSLAQTFIKDSEPSQDVADMQVEEPAPYHQNANPTPGTLSPLGQHDGLASKV